MTRIEKTVIGAGVGVSALLVAAMGVFYASDGGGKESKASAQNAPAATSPKPQWEQQSDSRQSPAVASRPASAPAGVTQLEPLPANAPNIPDANLLQLSVFVDLAGAREKQPDKAQWAVATAAAEKLLEGPCDCAQRIWLKHFVEMGNFAKDGNDAQFRETAKLMATLGRNDEQAMALSRK